MQNADWPNGNRDVRIIYFGKWASRRKPLVKWEPRCERDLIRTWLCEESLLAKSETICECDLVWTWLCEERYWSKLVWNLMQRPAGLG